MDKFRVAGLKYLQTPMVRCADPEVSRNILGFDYFHNQVLILNIERAEFSIRSNPPADLKMMAMKRGPQNHFEIPVRFGEEIQWAIFDTGCAMTIVDESILKSHPEEFSPLTVEVEGQAKPVVSTFIDATGKRLDGKLYFAEKMRVGELDLGRQLVTVIPFSDSLKDMLQSSMIFGANAMMTANWAFDLKNNLWAATSFATPASSLATVHATADQLIRQDQRYFTLLGNAKISRDSHSLSAPEIVFDTQLKLATCEKDCTLSEGDQTRKASKASIHITDKEWQQEAKSALQN